MSGFIPEITTTVSVRVNADALSDGISVINSHGWFDEIIEDLKQKKSQLEDLQDPVAETISRNLSEYQRQIISMKHYRSGMMANSVDVEKDGDGVYLVGNTAMSVDGFPYPLAIETGRRAVTPINAKYLRWWNESGEIVFSKYSKAVGADPFVQPSIDNTSEDVEQLITEYIDTILGD